MGTFNSFVLAQTGADSAFTVITQTIDLSRSTAEAWNRVWTEIFRQNIATGEAGLWVSLVRFSLTLAAICILFLAIKDGKNIVSRQSWSDLAAIFVWPLIVILFLSGDGNLLSNTVLFIRNFSTAQVRQVLEIQVGDLTFERAIANTSLTQSGRSQIDAIYLECRDKTGDALVRCWNDPAKQTAAQQIVADAERANGGNGLQVLRDYLSNLNSLVNPLGTFVERGLSGTLLDPLSAPLQKLAELILWGLTWAFLNALEAALLLTGIFAPIAMALSIIPMEPKPIWTWLIGLASLYSMQLGWNLLVGIMSTVLVIAGAQTITDLAFPLFIAIFAPSIVTTLSFRGGVAIYSAVSNSSSAILNAVSNFTGALTTILVRGV
jgi:hypothetical protein